MLGAMSDRASAKWDALSVAGPFDWERALARPRVHAAADVHILDGVAGAPSRWRTLLTAAGEVWAVTVHGAAGRDGRLVVEWDVPPYPAARHEALAQLGRMWQVDRDPTTFYDRVAEEPRLLPLLNRWRGIRPVRDASPWASLCRLILGQQVSVASHRTLVNRLLAGFGPSHPGSGLLRWPEATALAALSVEALSEAGIPFRTAATILRAARFAADGGLEQDREQARCGLLELRGVGPWTVAGVALFGWGEPDAALPEDLIIRRVLSALLADGQPVSASQAAKLLEPFRPHRGELCYLLWHHAFAPPA
jgi:3-methyladenine DNA glycosylase/8-oxoguanine DNA glycosylase